jgi:hypothetical protein
MTFIGVLLLWTACAKRRRTIYGKVIAGIGFVSWVILAAATPSITSLGINITVAASLLMEVWGSEHVR